VGSALDLLACEVDINGFFTNACIRSLTVPLRVVSLLTCRGSFCEVTCGFVDFFSGDVLRLLCVIALHFIALSSSALGEKVLDT
jgi:hypothetical protein